MAAEVAAGAGRNVLQIVFDAWGIPRSGGPRTPTAERSRNTQIGRGVSQGADWAIVADATRRAHERAVYEVVVAALALMPEPKPFGRPPMPEPSDTLRAAVAHRPSSAVNAVFPELVAIDREESPVMTTASAQFGRSPDDATLWARLPARSLHSRSWPLFRHRHPNRSGRW